MRDIAESLAIMVSNDIISPDTARKLYMTAFQTWIADHEHVHDHEEDTEEMN